MAKKIDLENKEISIVSRNDQEYIRLTDMVRGEGGSDLQQEYSVEPLRIKNRHSDLVLGKDLCLDFLVRLFSKSCRLK